VPLERDELLMDQLVRVAAVEAGLGDRVRLRALAFGGLAFESALSAF